jgi:hypothetical protein
MMWNVVAGLLATRWTVEREIRVAQILLWIEFVNETNDHVLFSDLYLACKAHLDPQAASTLIRDFELAQKLGYVRFRTINAEVQGFKVGVEVSESGKKLLIENKDNVNLLRTHMRNLHHQET